MDYKKIEKLIGILENSSLSELCIKDGDFEITMVRQINGVPTEEKKVTEDTEEEIINITSPLVGTFYSASGPTIPAYVKTGDIIRKGDTVCIIEAMKMMTEIQSDYDAEILAVLVSNGQKVEYGQPLFRIRKRQIS